MQDRDYYRSMPTRVLLILAAEEGLNPEMAIAIAEELASVEEMPRMVGQFAFNDKETTK